MTTWASYRKVSEGVILEHTTYNKVTSLFPALVLGPGKGVKSLLNVAQAVFWRLLAEGMRVAGYSTTDKVQWICAITDLIF